MGAQIDSLLPRGEHPVADLDGLGGLVAREDELGRSAIVQVAPQLLREAGSVLGGDGIGDGEDRLRRAVVALERHGVRTGDLEGEVEDVPRAGGAEAVDRLKVVSDYGHLRAPAAQAEHDVCLQAVYVLILVHEDVVEGPSHTPPDHLVPGERAPMHQQVVEVQQAELALARAVCLKRGRERVAMAGAPGEMLGEHLAEVRLLVDGARVDVEHRARSREALATVRQALLLADEVEQVRRVGRVEQPEVAAQGERGGVQAHHPMREGVKRAPGDPARVGQRALDQGARALDHLACGSTREREQQNSLGRDALAQQPCHAGAQGGRLTRACAGEDEQRTAGVRGRQALLAVEVLEPLWLRRRVEHPFDAREVTGRCASLAAASAGRVREASWEGGASDAPARQKRRAQRDRQSR